MYRAFRRTAAGLLVSLFIFGCGGGESKSPPPGAAAAPAAAPQAAERSVLFLGTSLTAGLGLDPDQAYPALVQEKIDSAGLPFHVVNAGVSGETAAGARRRLEWILRQPFDVMVLETGSNDMLRGANLDSVRADIQAIIDRVRQARPNARIVLAGMMAPPNLGARYAAGFGAMYPELARKNHLPLIPFLLQDVGGVADLNQSDGIHPNERGARIVAATVWKTLEPVLREDLTRSPSPSPTAPAR
jgi:acyl-CoA thioesterase-1